MAYTSIFFGEIDSAAEEAKITAKYVELTGKTPNPSDPEFATNATIAYASILATQKIDRAGKANLVRFATGANLDYIAELVGLKRITASPSFTTIRFTLVSGHAQVVIPSGTLVSTSDGQAVYATIEDTTVPVGTDTVDVDAECTTDGSQTNGYSPDSVTTIQNPQPYLQSATNIDITSGGADIESDVEFRERWALALEALSVAGPEGAYDFHARSASPTIIDTKTIGPEQYGYNVVPGTVEIRVLVDTGVPSQAIINAVKDACDPETVRPKCDTVLVYPATRTNYNLVIGITAFKGADTAALPALVQAAVQAYADEQGNHIGHDIVDDAITAAGKSVDGVKSVNLNGFTSLSINLRTFARCSSITCSVVAVEEP